MMQFNFERFVGIDWSGAKKEYQRGIQVAEFLRGEAHPKIKCPVGGRPWSRSSVLEYVASLTECRTLVGVDFAFSVPWSEGSKPLPACIERLTQVSDLWSLVNDFCKEEQFFYAGPIWRSINSPLRSFVLCSGHKGSEFRSNRLRRTESTAELRPETIYKIIGPKTVGAGSFAGMRFLHALRQSNDERIAIWPFDKIGTAQVVIVEVYPSLFYTLAHCKRPSKKQSDEDFFDVIRHTLAHFDVANGEYVPGRSIDKVDAVVISAALAAISKQESAFQIANLDRQDAMREGWIFGVS